MLITCIIILLLSCISCSDISTTTTLGKANDPRILEVHLLKPVTRLMKSYKDINLMTRVTIEEGQAIATVTANPDKSFIFALPKNCSHATMTVTALMKPSILSDKSTMMFGKELSNFKLLLKSKGNRKINQNNALLFSALLIVLLIE